MSRPENFSGYSIEEQQEGLRLVAMIEDHKKRRERLTAAQHRAKTRTDSQPILDELLARPGLEPGVKEQLRAQITEFLSEQTLALLEAQQGLLTLDAEDEARRGQDAHQRRLDAAFE